ncbi:cytochrome b2 [Phyllosticta citrichinensis]|uniref:Cytochrome b2 n=1 Tax=Phyllosticta citrichinensis TaxID=1130410 RepID=A0ABR1Y5I5_9PEZI
MADQKDLPYRITDLEASFNTNATPSNNASSSSNELLKPPPTASPPATKPPLSSLLSSYDFETVASRTLAPKTWAFYASAATDQLTRDANRASFDRIWWRPRVLRNVSRVSTAARMLGRDVAVPLFVSPAAMARLVHPDGERALAAACASRGVGQCISTNASYPLTEILDACGGSATKAPPHPVFFQLYVSRDRAATASLVRSLPRPAIAALFLTVDAPVPGKREADERVAAPADLAAPMSGARATNDAKGGGLGRVMGAYIDASLTWDDVAWLRSLRPDLPIVLKGIQGAADAMRAVEAGVQGIVVSNHGGRSLDTSPPAVLVLLELQRCCPWVFERLEVYVDGGVRRGTDVLKCLCLGATAVGMGRHFLYALNYGREGVEKLIDIMKDEIEVSMANLGVKHLDELHPGLVNTLDVDHLVPTTTDHPYAKWSPRSRLGKDAASKAKL